jgi:hypothetical protein
MNPFHLQISYWSFFIIQSLDVYLFLTLDRNLFTDPSILTEPTQFFIRANGTTLFPFALLVFMLRKYPVEGDVGKTVARSFTLFHGLVLLFLAWTRLTGLWTFGPFWASVGFHGIWFASGLAALIA